MAWHGAELPLSTVSQTSLGVQQVALAVLCAAVFFPGKWDTGFGGVTPSDTSTPGPQVDRWGTAVPFADCRAPCQTKISSLVRSNVSSK